MSNSPRPRPPPRLRLYPKVSGFDPPTSLLLDRRAGLCWRPGTIRCPFHIDSAHLGTGSQFNACQELIRYFASLHIMTVAY